MEKRTHYGSTNPHPDSSIKPRMIGGLIELLPEKEAYYRQLHAEAWPSVLEQMKRSHIQNFVIYLAELNGKKFLFSSYEYWGDDLEFDLQKMKEDPETQRWWKETDPCQKSLSTSNEWWISLEALFVCRSPAF